MSGRLGEWSIEDLLQIARITHKTTSIEVAGEHISGVIYLRNGAIVDAEVAGVEAASGSRFSQIVEAIEALSLIEEGSFEFGDRAPPPVDDRPIEVAAVTAAMQKDALREKRLTDLGLEGAEGLSINRHIDDSVTIKPAVWQLLIDLIDPFTLASLQQKMGRRKAVATLLTLDALGVLLRGQEVIASETPRGGPGPVVDEVSQDVEDVGNDGVIADEPDVQEDRAVEDDDAGDGESPVGEADLESDPVPEFVEMPAEEVLEVPEDSRLQSAIPLHIDAPIVEIFEPDRLPGIAPMHEVVTPSETTLVEDVLGDMRNRFRNQQHDYEFDDETPDGSSS